MELANLTYRSSEDRHSVSDSEMSPRKQLVQGRNIPVYLLESGRLPGIPKGRKVRKKKNHNLNKSTNSIGGKSYDIIDTNRTDISKVSTDIHPLVDSTRTEDSGMDFSFFTSHMASSRQTPYNASVDTSMDFAELHIPSPFHSIRLAHGLQRAMPNRRQTQSELTMTHGKASRSDVHMKGPRRTPPGKLLSDLKPPGSAPASEVSTSRLAQHHTNRPHKSSQSKRPVLESMEYEPNPEVVPFQPANFMSSTILKKVPIPKRHLDTFGGYEYNFVGRRGVMLHTDRYQVDFIKSFDGMTQRERLQAGLDYMEAIRGTRRRRELVPHRAQLDLIMGGKQIEFEERFDIAREIQKLKCIAMPRNAKELFHGRGIHLPNNHQSFHPRLPMPAELEDEVPRPTPSMFYPLSHLTRSEHKEQPKLERNPTGIGIGAPLRTSSTLRKHSQLPAIRGKPESDSEDKDDIPRVSLFRVRRTVSSLSARLGIPAHLHQDVKSVSKTHSQAPPPSREPSAWHSQQNKSEAKGTGEPVAQKKPTVAPGEMRGPGSEETGEVGHDGAKKDTTTEGSWAFHTEGETKAPDTAPSVVSSLASSHAPILPQIPPASSESRIRPTTEEGRKPPTPHPLRGTDLITSVPQDEQEQLRQTFQRLDTDADGHIKYTQLRTQLPKKFTREQEKFIEEVYNLTNAITFFGIDEFMVMNRLSKSVENLAGRAAEAYASIDFLALPEELLKYVGKFDDGDTGYTGKIDLDSLQKILADTVSPNIITDSELWDEILDSISVDFSAQVSKVLFIAHIPLFLSLEKDYK